MKKILVAYATREGQTASVGEHIARRLRETGHAVTLINVRDVDPLEDGPSEHDAIILAASVHAGRHEKEMIAFVKKNLDALSSKPTAFLSLSLTESTAEDPSATAAKREKAQHDVQSMLDAFIEETHWHPTWIKPVAGALAYTKYGFIVRYVMKRIARSAGGSEDTSRDHVYTNWDDLDRFVDDTMASLSSAAGAEQRQGAAVSTGA